MSHVPHPTDCIVVLDEGHYAVERSWARFDDAEPIGLPSQVAVDRRQRVHLLRRDPPGVLVFAPNGTFLFAYGKAIKDGHGLYADPSGRLFVTDRDAHQVIAFDCDGRELFRLGERDRPRWREPFNHPCDVAVGADGRIFVADGYGNARVHRFSATGEHEISWGDLGRDAGHFMTPHAIWVDEAGFVLVGDRENGRIQRFTAEGTLVDAWTGLQNPMDIYVDDGGRVHVTDQLPSLVLFDARGGLLGRCRPSLNGAHGLFGDDAGNLYLAEMNPPALTRMRLLPGPAATT